MTLTALARSHKTTRQSIFALLRRQGISTPQFLALDAVDQDRLLNLIHKYRKGDGISSRLDKLAERVEEVRQLAEMIRTELSKKA